MKVSFSGRVKAQKIRKKERVLDRNQTVWMTRLFMSFLVILALIFIMYRSLITAIDLPFLHMDGAFQTASALFRLQDGQLPGRDFLPYLGLGPIFFVFPFFWMGGGDLAASVFGAQFSAFLIIFLKVGFVGALAFPSRPVLAGLIISSLAWIYLWVQWDALFQLVETYINPGNSLRTFRSAAPYLFGALAYVLLKKKLSPTLFFGLMGSLAGIAFFWSNDYGIPTAFGVTCVALVQGYISKILSLKRIILLLVAAFFSGLMFVELATGGYAERLITFNFYDVLQDQYWYFPGPKIIFSHIFLELAQDIGWQGFVLVILLVLFFFDPTKENLILTMVGFSLAGAGVLTEVGGTRFLGYFDGYHLFCFLWGLFLFFVFLRFCAHKMLEKYAIKNKIIKKGAEKGVWCVLGGIIFVFLKGIWSEEALYRGLIENAREDPERFYVSELGGYLPIEWQEYVRLARSLAPYTLMEEYGGVMSAIQGKLLPVPVDSVIHALGNLRLVYKEALEDLPDVVVTTRRAASPIFQPWSLVANWWFHAPVIRNYQPVERSPLTIVWRRRKEPLVFEKEVPCEVHSGESPYFEVITSQPGPYEIELIYKINNEDSRDLVMVEDKIFIELGGDHSLNSKAEKEVFPVYAEIEGKNKYMFRNIVPQKGLSLLEVKACTARQIPFEDPDILWSFDPVSMNFIDENWVKGVGRQFAGFFVPNLPIARKTLTAGKYIRFANGEERKILSTEENGSYLNIYLDGLLLDGNEVGYPHKFEIMERR